MTKKRKFEKENQRINEIEKKKKKLKTWIISLMKKIKKNGRVDKKD